MGHLVSCSNKQGRVSIVAERGMPKAGELIAGKYRIDNLIGEGGMGAVFAATHALTGRRLAVKWLLPDIARNSDAVQRLFREAQATGRIDHPNVVDVYDVGEHDGAPFLVMELLQGETLTRGLERGALKIPDIIRMVVGAIDGVAAAHREGVIHRDIKPDNIFLCRDANGALQGSKVLDFGISKVSSIGGQLNPRLTKTGAIMGTPYYMSPEQIRGATEIDSRVDIYAFGVILYEALTGRVPFDGKTYSALVLEIATGTPARPCEVNPQLAGSLERVILKAMARDPDQRFQTLESMAKALAPFATGAAVHGGPGSVKIELGRTSGPATTPFVSEAPVVPVRRTPLIVAAVVGAGILALAFSAYLARQTPVTAIAAPAPPQASPVEPEKPAPAEAPRAVPAQLAAVATADAGTPVLVAPTPATLTPGSSPLPVPVAPSSGAGRGGREQRREPSSAAVPGGPLAPGRTGTISSDDF
jgi:serine/threonine-protein kinase